MIDYEVVFIVLCTFIAGFSYWVISRTMLFLRGAEEMKAQEMATAMQTLCNDFGINSSVFADSVIDYIDKLTESYTANGASGGNSVEYILEPTEKFFIVDNTSSLVNSYCRPRRLKCVYCDCISSKESGTCEHCGAPLVEDEY